MLTALHRLEISAALGQKKRRGEIDDAEYRQVVADFRADLAAGVFVQSLPVWEEVFSAAEGLALEHGPSSMCRSLDTLHVALALHLGVAEFCTFDERQATMARAAGLQVMP